MSNITISGLGSGLDYSDWITQLVAAKQTKIDEVSTQVSSITSKESALNTVKTDYTNLLDAIKAFTTTTSSSNVFNQKTSTSSSSAITTTVDSTAQAQNLSVSVEKLATSTTAKSNAVAGSYITGDTKVSEVSEGAIKEGTFSVYVKGIKSTIDITSTETMDDVKTALNAIDGVSASINSTGQLTISADDPENFPITVGSSSDTSNFQKTMALTKVGDEYTSSKSLFDTDTTKALTTGNFAGTTAITEGVFTIGSAKFTIDSSTTMDSLINEINNSADAGVIASWDQNAGKLSLVAKDQGAVNINVVAGDGDPETADSNFTDIMGLTSGGGLAENSQDLGTDAELTINGTSITSSSNTVTSDISGITGLTLTLNDKTTSNATVSVTADTTKSSEAIQTLVDAINTVLADTKSATGTTGKLYGESSLTSLGNKIRSQLSSSITGTDGYNTLASIGITTGKIGTSVSADTNQLSIDTEKLTAALSSNPDAVMKLLSGDNTTGTEGLLAAMETTVTSSLDLTKGYFAARESSYEKQVARLDKKITTMTANLTSYQKQLEAKFSAMDTAISKMKNSASIFDSYFNSSSSS